MKNNILMILGALVVVGGVFWAAASSQKSVQTEQAQEKATSNFDKLIRPHNITLGAADAPITLVEFLDPECEACGAMHPIVKKLMGEFDGAVRLVVRYMPLHGNSVYVANVLEIARAQGKFWEALDLIFSRQNEWASHHAPKPELIKEYMKTLSVDLTALGSATANEIILQRIKTDQKDGKALGVNRTPTFFVNGKKLDRIGYEALKNAIMNEMGPRLKH